MARYSDHRLLMILGAFDPLIQPNHMGSCQPALIEYNQTAGLYERPL